MNKPLQGTIQLPWSKSESNRALMIAAYGGFPLEVDHLSDAHDTVLLKGLLDHIHALSSNGEILVDCEDGGAVARFLMTYLAGKPGIWLLTGNDRLCQRPMAPLIESLRQLGADVVCTKTEGFLPVKIRGNRLSGGRGELDATQSSQFASSLLMAAPTWENGLRLVLKGKPVSEPYLDMTLAMMECCGIRVVRDGQEIVISHQQYHSRKYEVSADWSAASFWYELVALSDRGELFLNGLMGNSLQGDSAVVGMFSKLGVKTVFEDNGVCIIKDKSASLQSTEPIVFDFIDTPDLFPPVFVTCIALNIVSVFKGISILLTKESDRINSLITELSKIYTFINIVSDDEIVIEKSTITVDLNDIRNIVFNTHNDHRIAMSLVALRPRLGMIIVDNTSVVNKSYPTFWNELAKCY